MNPNELVEILRSAVIEAWPTVMARKSPALWDFDPCIVKALAPGFGPLKESAAYWKEVESIAWSRCDDYDTWSKCGYGIVASYASKRKAYAIPGFAEAKRFNNIYGS